MRTLTQIKQDIDRLCDRRAEVLHRLSDGHDATLAAEHKKLDESSPSAGKSSASCAPTIRFGDRDLIIQRARHEERLSRAA